MKKIFFAGGCFWGTQKYFDQFEGVVRTEVGYANGPDSAPTYEDVCRSSGHAETVLVEFDESRISPEELIRYFFMVIDPIAVNRQGHDIGIQYRTGIYYTEPEMLGIIMPSNEEVLMVMDLGYAAEGAAPLPNHASRKPLDETVSYL